MRALPSGAIAHVQVIGLEVVTGQSPTARIALLDRAGRVVGESRVTGFGDETDEALQRLFELIETDFVNHLGGGTGTAEVAPVTFGLPAPTDATSTDDGRVYDENA